MFCTFGCLAALGLITKGKAMTVLEEIREAERNGWQWTDDKYRAPKAPAGTIMATDPDKELQYQKWTYNGEVLAYVSVVDEPMRFLLPPGR